MVWKLVALLCALARCCLAGVISSPTTVNAQTYDYIVVGAGLCGITVASRLSENSSISVLVIEVRLLL